MPICFFNLLPNGKYSNLLIVATFFSRSLSGEISLPYGKAEILAVLLSKL